MLDLYSSSGKNQYSGAEAYSSKDASIQALRAPALTIVNEATPKTFEDELVNRGSVESGELARMHIFKYDVPKPYRNPNGGKMVLSKRLDSHMNKLMSHCNNQKASGEGSDPRAMDIPFPVDLFDAFSRACVDCENKFVNEDSLKLAMITRAPIKVLKVAGLLAVMDNQVITDEHWAWALKLFHYEFSMMQALVGVTRSSANELDSAIDNTMIPCIVKLLNNEYDSSIRRVNENLRKLGIFTMSAINNIVKAKKDISDLSTSGKSGVVRCLDHMVMLGYLERVSKERMQQISLKNKDYSAGYEITRNFAIYWKNINTRKTLKI
jgi:hypothetical protein